MGFLKEIFTMLKDLLRDIVKNPQSFVDDPFFVVICISLIVGVLFFVGQLLFCKFSKKQV